MKPLTKNTLLLGIDFGTGGCKITAIDWEGNVKAEASWEYPTHHPKPFYSEQNPGDWLTAFVSCLEQIEEQGHVNLSYIDAVCLDASTHNAVLLDKDMKVIRPVIMWTDQRSGKEVEYLEKSWGEDIFRIGYQKVAPTWTLPQMLWIKNNEPDNYKRIHKVMFVKDYIRYLLIESWETDYIDAQGTLFFDMAKMEWSPELCGLIGLPVSTLPPICKPTDITGKITEGASKITGLKAGTPVVCGTSDSAVEDYGAGAIRPGQCIIKLATAGNVNVMASKAVPHPRTLTYSHVVPGMWYTVAATNTAASSMRWFRDTFCGEEIIKSRETGTNVYQLMEEKAREIPVGCEGLFFHPYLMGERSPYWDSSLRASFTGASMSHGKGHFTRAVMEGVAFSLKDCFRLIDETGLDVTEFILIGGGAKSEIWSQIICDVFGKRVSKPLVTDASFGSALLAGVGTGVFTDAMDAVQKCVKTEKEVTPDAENHQKYNELFRYYREIHDKMEGIYHDINK
ncbi:MAG: xylulokinase [Bacteroidetes bacterium GWA2_42_15]|nr:MAG: xylulokinase [Bacteroidetes bacterium GWA2_42_15]